MRTSTRDNKSSDYFNTVLIVLIVLALLVALTWNSERPFWTRIDNAISDVTDEFRGDSRDVDINIDRE